MCIIIRQDAPECPKRPYRKNGFTLPEVLVSLAICLLLLQSVWQWSLLAERSRQRAAQNEQAVFLAQSVLAEQVPQLPQGWQIDVAEQELGAKLTEKKVTVSYGAQVWQFYYAMRGDGDDE